MWSKYRYTGYSRDGSFFKLDTYVSFTCLTSSHKALFHFQLRVAQFLRMAAKAWSVQVRDVKARDANGAHDVQVQIQETTQLPTAKSFLLSQPSGGVYTCARATRSRGLATTKHELVLWDFHLERLATGIRSVATDISNAAGFATEAQWITEMQRVTTALCEDVLRYLSERERPPVDADLMVTALWWTEPSSAEKLRYNVSVHACVMPTVRIKRAVYWFCHDSARITHPLRRVGL